MEVEGAPDRGAPLVSLGAKRKKGRGGGAGPAGVADWANLGRLRVRGKRKVLRAEAGPAGEMRERGRGEEKGFPFLLKFLFKFIFQTFKLQSNKIHAFES
jgi:hypothetical protein